MKGARREGGRRGGSQGSGGKGPASWKRLQAPDRKEGVSFAFLQAEGEVRDWALLTEPQPRDAVHQ